MSKLLDSIHTPRDLRALQPDDLPQVAREVRDVIIETVSETGGHLGAGLGATDLAVALHYVLNTPEDFLVWDVGHQVQAHKILTGRKDSFRKTFRQYKGISGLANKDEGPYDPFTTGHGGPSISTALGAAVARRLQKKSSKSIAVIGDASIASGMAFEALNHAGHLSESLVVILNDNEMSISPSVGALSKYLNKVISNPIYNSIRQRAERLITQVPKVGKGMINKAKLIEEGIKHLLVPGLIFEALGFRYFGPIDGHNIPEMVKLFPNILKIKGPIFIHVITQKGKGYPIAEQDPERWHASAPFYSDSGELKKVSTEKTYTQLFGQTMVDLAGRNPKITALTGGMMEGTGLVSFSKLYPDRFFDVGISEEHGVTFCAGLANEGMRPVAAIYSTFLQRAHDQIIHDVALQNIPVVFCMDRAGLVGEDGPTHHGVFDIAYMRKIPGMVVLAPRDGQEFAEMLEYSIGYTKGPISIRYPRGAVGEQLYPELHNLPRQPIEFGKSELLREGSDVLFLAVGSMVGPCLVAAEALESEKISSAVVNTRFLKPLDESLILRFAREVKVVVTVEEGCITGGFGAGVLELLSEKGIGTERVVCLGIPDKFIEHGARSILLDLIGLTPEKIAQSAKAACERLAHAPLQGKGTSLPGRRDFHLTS